MEKEDKFKLFLSLACLVVVGVLVFSLVNDYTINGSVNNLFSAVKDIESVKISNIRINPSSQSVNFIWKTNKLSTSKVDYGKTLILGNTAFDSEFTLNHLIDAKKLNGNSTYYYIITSCDMDGNCASTKVGNFYTPPVSGLDKTPPEVSNLALDVYDNLATIIFDTEEPSNTIVDYGTDTNLNLQAIDSGYTTRHIIDLKKLSNKTLYYYKIKTCDVNVNCARSDLGSFETNP